MSSFYTKYRPQKVAELDLVEVRKELSKILDSGNFSQSYLFAGPKGTGKTSSARILAKILNCQLNREALELRQKQQAKTKIKLVEPCGECEGCVSVTRGSNLSVMEMDAASNRGIDDIREIRERIGLAPVSGLFNVYVIDEVHMLTTEAFNALLKTLEEPPAHAVFVLATTDPHKVPETVVSRCTTIRFSRGSEAEISHSLNRVIQAEALVIEPAVVAKIAQRADGSFRDAVKILEQAASGNNTISEETVDRITGFSSLYDPEGLIELLWSNQTNQALALIAAKEKEGIDFWVWGGRLTEAVRQRLMAVIMAGKSEEISRWKDLCRMMMEAVSGMKNSVIASLPLELMVVEWTTKKQDIVHSEQGIGNSRDTKEETDSKIRDSGIKKQELVNGTQKTISGKELELEEVKAKWGEMMRVIKPLNHSLEALLRAARPIGVESNQLTIEVAYAFHKEQLEQERHRIMVEQKMSEVLGASITVKLVLGAKAIKATVKSSETDLVANVTGKLEDEALAKAAEEIFS